MTMPLQAKALRKKLLEFERLAHLCLCPPLVFCTSCTCSAVVLYAGDTPVNGGHLGHTGRHLVHLALVEEEESALLVSGLYTCSAVVLHDGDTPVNGGHLGHTGRHLVHQALDEGGNRSTDLAGVFHTVLGFKMTKKTI